MINDVLSELRILHEEICTSDGGECEMMALVRRGADEIERLRAHEHAAATILATALACDDYQPQHMEWMAEAARWLNEPRAAHEPGALPVTSSQATLDKIREWADTWSKPPHSDASESDKGWFWAAQEVQNLLDPNPPGASRDASSHDQGSLTEAGCSPAAQSCEWTATAGNPDDDSQRTGPADLVGALQDVVHTDPGPVRAGKAVKSIECPECFGDKQIAMSDWTSRFCEYCGGTGRVALKSGEQS